MSTETEKTQISIEERVNTHKDYYFNNDRSRLGYGVYTALDAINSVKTQERKAYENDFDKKKFASGPTVNAKIGKKYFDELGTIEEHFSKYSKQSITYSRLDEKVQVFVSKQLQDLSFSEDSFLVAHPRFRHAWFNDMLRAAILGLSQTDCELLDFPQMYLDNLDGGLEEEISDKKPGFIRRNLIPIGFATVLLALAGIEAFNLYVWNEAKNEAKQTLEQKEREWERKVNAVPFQAIKALEDIADKCIKEYYSDIDLKLPLPVKYRMVCERFKKEGKEELKTEFKNEVKTELNNIKNKDVREWFDRFFGNTLDDE